MQYYIYVRGVTPRKRSDRPRGEPLFLRLLAYPLFRCASGLCSFSNRARLSLASPATAPSVGTFTRLGQPSASVLSSHCSPATAASLSLLRGSQTARAPD